MGIQRQGRIRSAADECSQCDATPYSCSARSLEKNFRRRASEANAAMILVDTSILVAWLDSAHPDHNNCLKALDNCAAVDELAISSVTFAELAAGGRNRDKLDKDLAGLRRLDLDFDTAFRAGKAFCQSQRGEKQSGPVLPDFLIRAQAAALNLPHLTNDRRRLRAFPELDLLFPEA